MSKLIEDKVKTINTKPFLRWAGGKSWLLKDLETYLPQNFNNYHEPFIGGGSVFIYLKSKGRIKNNALLSDQNEDLINAYKAIKQDPITLIKFLKKYRNTKEFYYDLREQRFQNRIEKAAQFIFLNRTSFNGIYRVNLKGEYNVPYGFKKYKQLFDFENLKKICELLTNTKLEIGDFEVYFDEIQKDDLVFLDPPYTVAHENNGFIKYNQKIFAWEDQERLERYIEKIKEKQAYFILTNAAHKNINDLFQNIGAKHELNRYSVVGGKGAKRQKISEYIFTNC
ncbi:MAG: Dam family site-specific DNA-(adenine-N6)-methyltransferase [Candidatus Peribacteraceae bacterium]|nr:Dam family site-specific DNA-(adenine-N6)-methyltransferase [Candidatus Peribacteraceae bacterium]